MLCALSSAKEEGGGEGEREKILSSVILIVIEELALLSANYEGDLGEHVFGLRSSVVEVLEIFHGECISYHSKRKT